MNDLLMQHVQFEQLTHKLDVPQHLPLGNDIVFLLFCRESFTVLKHSIGILPLLKLLVTLV